jgi:hypothetical protein
MSEMEQARYEFDHGGKQNDQPYRREVPIA